MLTHRVADEVQVISCETAIVVSECHPPGHALCLDASTNILGALYSATLLDNLQTMLFFSTTRRRPPTVLAEQKLHKPLWSAL